MTLATDITADLGTIFLTDFAEKETATTWATEISAIFDEDYVEFNDISSVSPFLLVKSSDVPSTSTTGDLFTVAATNYKLVDRQRTEPGITRIVLAKV